MTSIFQNISGWVNTNIYQPLLKAVKGVFGISSPAKKMHPIGKEIITGIIHGMIAEGKHLGKFVADIFGSWPKALGSFISKGAIDLAKLPSKALSALGSVFGSLTGRVGGFFSRLFGAGGGRGVTQWAGTVSRALTMLGLPQSLAGRVLYQMQTESGGNPKAINLTDINARRGDPSRGLLQTIGSTFSAFHVPGTSWNIYDPLANIAAAVNYARHTYGPSLMNARGQGMGSGHGYDTGGWLPPGVTLAYNRTGQPERILSPNEFASLHAGGTQYHAHFDGLTLATIDAQVRSAFHLMSLTSGNLARQGRRS
jgi:hypothetical protein